MKVDIEIKFAWYDLWVGVFIDTAKRRAYVCPVPMLVFVFDWGRA